MVCSLHRGLGGAIRRARTRLPGGGDNPVAIIRIPRERMIGYGIASSLVHEVGHQGAALLGLVESLRAELRDAGSRGGTGPAWALWERWISEIVADFWSIGKVGIGSTLGLIGLVSLPRGFVFRPPDEDPHPMPWMRVLLSCAIGERLYPDPQWGQLAGDLAGDVPAAGLRPRARRRPSSELRDDHAGVRHRAGRPPTRAAPRPVARRGAAQPAICDRERCCGASPRGRPSPDRMAPAPPTLAFAVLGQARASGRLDPGTGEPAAAPADHRLGGDQRARDRPRRRPVGRRRCSSASRPSGPTRPDPTQPQRVLTAI